MHVLRVDPDRCQGHARCAELAPEAFDTDDEGYSSVRPGLERLEDVPAAIAAAVANCPELAITLRQA